MLKMRFKFLILTLVLILLSFKLFGMEMEQYSPETTKIVWDFHGVIARHDIWKIKHDAWENIWELSKIFRPSLLYYLCSAACTLGTHGEWGVIATNYPELACVLTKLENDVNPIPETVEIIKELNQLGYEQDLASDINTSFLEDLERESSFKEILQVLVNKKSVDYGKYHAICKYNKQYFIEYQQEYNPTNKHVIFIDDWQINVANAQRVGLTGILFESPDQVREELQLLNILP